MKINYEAQTLSTEAVNLVSGGHPSFGAGWMGLGYVAAVVLAIPHVREFYNYMGERARFGCDAAHLEEEDYFTQHICSGMNYGASFFSTGNSTVVEVKTEL